MTRHLALFVIALVAACSMGCQQDAGEPVAEGRKYEAADDSESNGDAGESSTTDAGSAGAEETVATTASGTSSTGDAGAATLANGLSNPSIALDPPSQGTSDAGSPKTASTAAGADVAAGDPDPSSPSSSTDSGNPPAKSNQAAGPEPVMDGRQSIPFRLPNRGQGITMASYEPPKNGTPKQLLDHLRNLSRVNLKGRNQQEQMADLAQLMQGRILSSEMLMNAPRATLNERLLAVNTKIETLNLLNQMGNTDVLAHAMQFAAALKKHPIEEMARKGRIIYLSLAAGEMVDPDSSDPKWVAEEVNAILDEEPVSIEICETLQEAIGRLVRAGEIDAAKLSGAKLIETYGKSESKPIQEMVGVFRDEMGLVELDYAKKLEAAMSKDPSHLPALVTAAETASRLGTRGHATMQVLAQSGQMMEFYGHYDAATKIYTSLEDGYQDWADKPSRASVMRTVKAAKQRLGLIGKPFKLEGDVYGGSPLDWEKYKGKVVLIDFWATWCVPCLQEIPNIQANYERYRDRGFEVVGYNLDEDAKQLDAFFKNQQLPWESVLGKDPKQRGFGKDPFANSLGIDGIPFVLLLNREGKVEAIHVRGESLGEHLERLLGDEPAAKDDKPADSPTGTKPAEAKPEDKPVGGAESSKDPGKEGE